ncbi:hypothetical protein DFH09DRAFT_1089115 [Mycena vulgaris]|nr:hypothetical protein DFH09DRAFT_1089115 [Mycena vulgaris]
MGQKSSHFPPKNLPVSSLIEFQLPPQRKSTVYSDPTNYLAELPPTLTAFNVTEIVVPPSVVVKALGCVHARNWQVVRAPRYFELNAPFEFFLHARACRHLRTLRAESAPLRALVRRARVHRGIAVASRPRVPTHRNVHMRSPGGGERLQRSFPTFSHQRASRKHSGESEQARWLNFERFGWVDGTYRAESKKWIVEIAGIWICGSKGGNEKKRTREK